MKTYTECLLIQKQGHFWDLCCFIANIDVKYLQYLIKDCKKTFFYMPHFLKVASKNNLQWNKGKEKRQISSFKLRLRDNWYGQHSKKRRRYLDAIPAIVFAHFHQPKSHYPAHHPAVPLITTFSVPLFLLFNRPGGQPLLNSPNGGRLTHGCRLQAVKKPQKGVIDEL